MRTDARLALLLATAPVLLSTPQRAQTIGTDEGAGSVRTIGCASRPAGSLVVLGGAPSMGETLRVGVDDPTGTMPRSSVALLWQSATPPEPSCGLVLPDFGLGGQAGELAIGSTSVEHVYAPALWTGPGQPASFAVALPESSALDGARVYLQGALVAADGSARIGMTEAIEVTVGSGRPEISVRSAWVGPIPVAPGESLVFRAIVRNTGSATARDVLVRGRASSGAESSAVLDALAPGEQRTVALAFDTDESWTLANPHFFTAEIGPDLSLTAQKPAFVVPLELVEPVQPPGRDEVLTLANGKVTRRVVRPVAAESAGESSPAPVKGARHPMTGAQEPVSPPRPRLQPRIDPTVAEADRNAAPGEWLEYLIDFEVGVPMPRLPQLARRAGRFSPVNVPILEQRLSRLEAVRRARMAAAAPTIAALEQAGGRMVEFYTLAGAMLVRAPKGHLDALAADPLVEHVEGLHVGRLTGDLDDVRAEVHSEAYFDLGATGSGFVAILDGGVRASHDLLSAPDHIAILEDCFDGDGDCNDTGSALYDTDDDCDHGTFVTATITGNGNHGDDDRGITSGTVDHWRVTQNNAPCNIGLTAVHRAFDQAVTWGDHIVNCSFRFDNVSQDEHGSVADDADDAFQSGCVVLAGVGNDGATAGNVGSPALAQKALGIGAYDFLSGGTMVGQSLGPAPDDRIKPDLQTLTNFQGAGADADDDVTFTLGGTSSATPVATGAASIFSDWFSLDGQVESDAGQVYAALIEGGNRDFGQFNNTQGVGHFALPLNGTYHTGSVNVGFEDNEYVWINVPVGTDRISAAIWWAENPGQSHRDIDLYLYRPDGSISDSSLSVPSVFERVEVTAPITSGWREVRIHGYDVPLTASVTVYYAIHMDF